VDRGALLDWTVESCTQAVCFLLNRRWLLSATGGGCCQQGSLSKAAHVCCERTLLNGLCCAVLVLCSTCAVQYLCCAVLVLCSTCAAHTGCTELLSIRFHQCQQSSFISQQVQTVATEPLQDASGAATNTLQAPLPRRHLEQSDAAPAVLQRQR
jgi:hypothetical protein